MKKRNAKTGRNNKGKINRKKIGALFMAFAMMSSTFSVNASEDLLSAGEESEYTTDFEMSNTASTEESINAEELLNPEESSDEEAFVSESSDAETPEVGTTGEDLLESSQEAEVDTEELLLAADDEITDSEAEEVGVSGSCGENLTWTLENGVLTISGSGSMTSAPWNTTVFRTSIKSVVIAGGVTSIYQNAFENCANLQSVTFGNSVTTIGGSAFKNCTSLTSVQLSTSVTQIGYYAFQYCSKLTSITLPSSVTQIGNYAFQGTGLISLTLPGNAAETRQYAFQDCSNLKTVYLGDGFSMIYKGLFKNCTSLENIRIPASVTYIAAEAFEGCTGLTDVYYGGKSSEWSSVNIREDNELLTSASVHYATLDAPVLSAPTIISTGIKLSWNAVSGAEKYRVLYRVTGSSWQTADTSNTSYVVTGLTTGKNYQFTVRCINAAGTSYTSAAAAVQSTAYLAVPVISSLTLAATGVNVKWSAVSGAEKYRIFYKQSGASSWTKAGDTTGTSYTVSNLTSGKTYIFTVRCINAEGTAFTSFLNSTGKSILFVKAPQLSGAANAASGITVKWAASQGAGKYRVFYKVSGASSWTKAGDTTGTSYTVTGLTSGKTYVFTVRCMNNAGTTYTSSYDSSGKSLLYLAQPKVTAAQASKGVKVSWNKISGAAGYAVYRKVSGGSWTKIKNISSGSTISFTDTTGTSGTRYYYTVRAYKGSVLSSYAAAGASAIAK